MRNEWVVAEREFVVDLTSIRRSKFPFRKQSLPFQTVDASYNGRLHTLLQRKLKETKYEKNTNKN